MKIFTLAFFLMTFKLSAGDFWLPATIQVGPDGSVTHTLPLPTSMDHFENDLVGKVGYGVWPITSGSFNKFKRIIALRAPTGVKDVSKLKADEEGVLQVADSRSGYLVIENRDWDMELGVGGVVFGEGVTMIYGGINISGSFGKTYTVSRRVKRFEEIKHLKKPNIPTDLRDLDTWMPEDSLSWQSRRGFAFSLEAGVGPLAVGGTAFARGSYGIEIQKTSLEDHYDLILNMERVKEKGFSVYSGVLIGGAALEKLKSKTSSFTYKFNLKKIKKYPITFFPSSKKAKWKEKTVKMSAPDAYFEMINGNLVVAQKLAKIKGSGVIKVEQKKTTMTTRALKVGVSIPFLISTNYMIGKSFIVSDTKYLDPHTIGESFVGVYNKELETTGLLSRNLVRTRIFTGNFQRLLNDKTHDHQMRVVSQRYSGNYKYSYIRNRVTRKMLDREFRRIRRKVGFSDEFHLKIPEDKLGTIQIELDVRLSNYSVDFLMALALKKKEKPFLALGEKVVRNYFKNDSNPKEACRIQLKRPCREFKLLETKKYLKKAYASLVKMSLLKKESNYKSFVKSFANFGEGFIRNRFTLRTILKLANDSPLGPKKQKSVVVNFAIQGSKIRPYEKELQIK